MILTKNDALNKINYLSKNSIPFLFLISFDMSKNIVLSKDEIDRKNIRFQVGNITNDEIINDSNEKFIFTRDPIKFEVYEKSFCYVQSQISEGNSYLVNLTFPSKVNINKTLLQLYKIAKAKYKLYFNDEFVVFSPESFIKINNRIISTYPMKGTIDSKLPNADEIILNDEKEMAEHITIVDLLRNDLSIVSKDVTVEKFRYLDYIKTNFKTIIQVSSKIVGNLENDFKQNLGELIFALLPAGSISGAPKKKTIEIIRNAEIDDRGFYTGIFGWFDGENLDSAVMIRFIQKSNDHYTFRSGGGITYQSNLYSEYQELIDKIYVPIH